MPSSTPRKHNRASIALAKFGKCVAAAAVLVVLVVVVVVVVDSVVVVTLIKFLNFAFGEFAAQLRKPIQSQESTKQETA